MALAGGYGGMIKYEQNKLFIIWDYYDLTTEESE